MSNVTRQHPFADMMTLRDAMNDLLAESFVRPRTMPGFAHKALDLYETEQEYVAKLAVPGLKPEDFEITLQNNELTVRGQTKQEHKTENTRYHIQEQHYGAFERTVRFPEPVDADKVSASLSDGILTIQVPRAEEARPRRITIQSKQA